MRRDGPVLAPHCRSCFRLWLVWSVGRAAGAAAPGLDDPTEHERVESFLREFRKAPGARAHFEVAHVDGVRTSVATSALKKGAVVARTPAARTVGAGTSASHRLLADRCLRTGEAHCTSAVFAAAALWLCTAEGQACRSYARMLPTLRQLRNFAAFTEAEREFTRALEPALAERWLGVFDQLKSLVGLAASELKKAGPVPPASPAGRDADEDAHHRSLWWALGTASTRAMILPKHTKPVGHINMALFPALDMFNFHANDSQANVAYSFTAGKLDVVTRRQVSKGEELRIAKDVRMHLSPLESLVNQGFYLEELRDGPEIKVDADRVPYDAQRAARFGCAKVLGYFQRGSGATWPPETLSCMHVMWYPVDDAIRALAAGHLRPAALPVWPPEARTASGDPPSAAVLKRWRKLDAQAWSYLGGLCKAGLKSTREALASPAARELAAGAAGSVSSMLLAIARESEDIYKRCGSELQQAFGATAQKRPHRRAGAGEL